jgi:hypothetical protein
VQYQSPAPQPERYRASFDDGPWDRSTQPLPTDPSGEPPDFITIATENCGVYLRAGVAQADGTLPYSWLQWDHVQQPVALVEAKLAPISS